MRVWRCCLTSEEVEILTFRLIFVFFLTRKTRHLTVMSCRTTTFARFCDPTQVHVNKELRPSATGGDFHVNDLQPVSSLVVKTRLLAFLSQDFVLPKSFDPNCLFQDHLTVSWDKTLQRQKGTESNTRPSGGKDQGRRPRQEIKKRVVFKFTVTVGRDQEVNCLHPPNPPRWLAASLGAPKCKPSHIVTRRSYSLSHKFVLKYFRSIRIQQ